jgi:hypothetical protein
VSGVSGEDCAPWGKWRNIASAMAKRTVRQAKVSGTKSVPSDLVRDAKRVAKIAASTKLPAIEEAISYGTPSLKVKGKFLSRVREPGVLVLMCTLEEKEMLIQANPAVYFETDHYKGWPAILIRLPKIGDAELKHRIAIAWRLQAPKKLIAAVDAA